MKNRLMWGVLVVAALAVAIAGVNAAAAKAYQFTGTVKTVTGATFTVEKSATETWEFSTDKDTKGAPKVGDKVTVYYRMIATEIEVKPAAAVTKKK
jgi:predicted membrane-bound dolichyl-phosphate-mannose-protein mannosyltransferase